MTLYEQLTTAKKAIADANRRYDELVIEIQNACVHPKQHQEHTGYNYNDGYGGSCANHWVSTGVKCAVCNKQLENK